MASQLLRGCAGNCRKVHICISLDESGSIGKKFFNGPAKDFAKAVVSAVEVAAKGALYSVVSFASRATLDSELKDWNATVTAINDLRYSDGATNTAGGIRLCSNIVAPPDTTNVLILITDGFPNVGGGRPGAKRVAALARQRGIVVVSVGVGRSVSKRFLSNVASNSSRVFTAADYNSLDNILEEVVSAPICN